MPSVTRTPACRVKGCPAPRDPDFHIPICGHGLEGHHHHVVKRSQGGKDGPQVFICPECHRNIDEGEWGNSIDETFEDGARVTMYRAWDLHNKTVIEQVIGIAPSTKEESDGRDNRERGGDSGLGSDRDRIPSTGSFRGRSAANVAPQSGAVPHGDGPDVERDSNTSPLTHEQRVAIAANIKAAEWGRQWLAGDTANEWEAELNEDFWNLYANDFGYEYESLRNIQRTCDAIPMQIRRYGKLRFSHHVVVAQENREDMEMWLDECEKNEWSVAEFRRQVKGAKKKVKRYSLEELGELCERFGRESNEGDDITVSGFLDWLEEQND